MWVLYVSLIDFPHIYIFMIIQIRNDMVSIVADNIITDNRQNKEIKG